MPGRVRPDIDLGVNPNPFRTCRTISGFPFTVQWLGFVMIALTEAMRFSSSTSPTGRGNDRRPGAPWLAWLRTGDTGAAGVVQAPLSCAEEARVSEIAEKRFAPSAPVGVRTRAPRGRQQPSASEAVLISAISLTRASFGDAAKLYAAGRDLKEPQLSPIYGDFSGFPPTILTTGTRDLFLSNTVRTHRKLRRSEVEADLNVYEGQSHAHYLSNPDAPETKEAFIDIASFFDKHLGK